MSPYHHRPDIPRVVAHQRYTERHRRMSTSRHRALSELASRHDFEYLELLAQFKPESGPWSATPRHRAQRAVADRHPEEYRLLRLHYRELMDADCGPLPGDDL